MGKSEYLLVDRAPAEPPLTPAGVAGYAGLLALEVTVSGPIPEGPTTAPVTYFVLDRAKNAIVGNLTLPNASPISRAFQLNVKVPDLSDSLDVGVFDAAGGFVSAGFKVEAPTRPQGAIGPIGP
ncbi:MAG: hypothetical protein JWQ52_2264 [Phenylobacterium sp.]|jgi:hypothetical protein|nr:hypothetical protein [Phenylobacterium sp.]